MKQDIMTQIDVYRTSNYIKSDAVTIYNNSPKGNKIGTVTNTDAVSSTQNGVITLNPWFNAFEKLGYSDSLTFTAYNYTSNQDMEGKCIKFTITDVVDADGYSLYHQLVPANSISYIKMYDGTTAFSGTITLKNIACLEDYTKVIIKTAFEIVDYNYTIFESDTYKIKEYTEAEYSKNVYGAEYNLVAGFMGYYYYLEMGQYPQDYAGDDINNALNAVYGNEDDIFNLSLETRNITTANGKQLKLALYEENHERKIYNQVLWTKYLNASGNENTGYKVCPIYWFKDLNTGDIYARSQVYAYSATDTYANTETLVGQTANKFNWFKVMPTKWIIYSLENGNVNTIKSGSANAVQLKTITDAVKNNILLKVYAEKMYDTTYFTKGDNNWASHYMSANLNGTTGLGVQKIGSNTTSKLTNSQDPYKFNTTSLTNYVNTQANSTYNLSNNYISSFLERTFTENENNSIAYTQNITLFAKDDKNSLFKSALVNNTVTNTYYSKSTEKLYPLAYGIDYETNIANEFNSGVLLRIKLGDYVLSHWFYYTRAEINHYYNLRSGGQLVYNVFCLNAGSYNTASMEGNMVTGERPAFHFQPFTY